jgi:hypothetical protein
MYSRNQSGMRADQGLYTIKLNGVRLVGDQLAIE